MEFNDSELRACPFRCGSHKLKLVDLGWDDPWFAVQCSCGATMGSMHSFAEAIAKWNARADNANSPNCELNHREH